MKSFTLTAAAAVLACPAAAVASDIRCVHENNHSLALNDDGEKIGLELGDLAGHKLAKILQLPGSHQPYLYASAKLEFAVSECHRSQDGKLFSCYKQTSEIDLSSPSVTRSLDFVYVNLERHTIDQTPWGRSEFYKVTFDSRDTETGKRATESWNYNIDWCRSGR